MAKSNKELWLEKYPFGYYNTENDKGTGAEVIDSSRPTFDDYDDDSSDFDIDWDEYERSLDIDDDMSDEDADYFHSNLYGGDRTYCADCGNKLVYGEDGYSYCPDCNTRADEEWGRKNEDFLEDRNEDLIALDEAYLKESREVTSLVIDMIEDGTVSAEDVARMCLTYLSEADAEEIANTLLDDEVETYGDVRQYTNALIDLCEEGSLSWDTLVNECLQYMSEDDVRDMAHSNELIDDDEEKESSVDTAELADNFKDFLIENGYREDCVTVNNKWDGWDIVTCKDDGYGEITIEFVEDDGDFEIYISDSFLFATDYDDLVDTFKEDVIPYVEYEKSYGERYSVYYFYNQSGRVIDSYDTLEDDELDEDEILYKAECSMEPVIVVREDYDENNILDNKVQLYPEEGLIEESINESLAKLKDLVASNGHKLVKYDQCVMGHTYKSVFDYSSDNGGTLDGFKYYNDYVVDVTDSDGKSTNESIKSPDAVNNALKNFRREAHPTSDLDAMKRNAVKAAERDGYNQLIVKDADGSYSIVREYPGSTDNRKVVGKATVSYKGGVAQVDYKELKESILTNDGYVTPSEGAVEQFLNKYGFGDDRYQKDIYTDNASKGKEIIASFVDGINSADYRRISERAKEFFGQCPVDVRLGKEHKDGDDLWATLVFDFGKCSNGEPLQEGWEPAEDYNLDWLPVGALIKFDGVLWSGETRTTEAYFLGSSEFEECIKVTYDEEDRFDTRTRNYDDIDREWVTEVYYEDAVWNRVEDEEDFDESLNETLEGRYCIVARTNDGKFKFYKDGAFIDDYKEATIFTDMDEARAEWFDIDKSKYKRVFIPNYDESSFASLNENKEDDLYDYKTRQATGSWDRDDDDYLLNQESKAYHVKHGFGKWCPECGGADIADADPDWNGLVGVCSECGTELFYVVEQDIWAYDLGNSDSIEESIKSPDAVNNALNKFRRDAVDEDDYIYTAYDRYNEPMESFRTEKEAMDYVDAQEDFDRVAKITKQVGKREIIIYQEDDGESERFDESTKPHFIDKRKRSAIYGEDDYGYDEFDVRDENPLPHIKLKKGNRHIQLTDTSKTGEEGHPIQTGLRGRVNKFESILNEDDNNDLFRQASKAYKVNDNDFFTSLSDDELVTLWVSCSITDGNPYGAPYDDEVYDAIADRPNSRELFDKSTEIIINKMPMYNLVKVYARYYNQEPDTNKMGRERIVADVLKAIKKNNLTESKQLNEGPGAGYTLSGKMSITAVESLTPIKYESADYGSYDVTFNCVALGKIEDFEFYSYMYGDKMDSAEVEISAIKTNFYAEHIDDIEALVRNNLEEVKDCLVGATVRVDYVYGAGWLHSKFDGTIAKIDDTVKDSDIVYGDTFDIEVFEFDAKIKDTDVIEYVDKAVTGDNFSYMYTVIDEDGNPGDAFFEEDDAIEYAKKHHCQAVDKTECKELFGGDTEWLDSEIVWENPYEDIYDAIYEKASQIYKSSEINADILEKVARRFFDLSDEKLNELISRWKEEELDT